MTHACHPACTRSRTLGATLTALLASSALVAPAHAAAPLFTTSWLAGRAAAASVAARAGTLSPQSYATVQRSMANLQQAAQALARARAAQLAARAAGAALASAVPDGLAPGGLAPLPAAGWAGANLPTQGAAAGRTTVTVQQTTKQAVLNWRTFNVGRNTTLTFDQSAGGAAANTWVALNKVSDPSLNPSQILGSIQAPGQVYILNPNGIIFGATAQVNVGALLAATAGFSGGDAQFLSRGIYSASAQGAGGLTTLLPAFQGATGPITVAPGAQIATNAPSSALAGGGFVMLLGKSVQNAGSIDTPGGQTALAAGSAFTIVPGYSVSSTGGTTSGNFTSTVLGSEIAVANGGAVGNTGIVTASTGDITLVGQTVTQGGVVLSTTSAAQRGTVHLLTPLATQLGAASYALDATASVTLAPGSTTAILLDASSGTALNAQRAGAIAASATNDAARFTTTTLELNDQVRLSDRQDESRIEITTGGLVDFQAGSLSLATGGQVAVTAGKLPGGPSAAYTGTLSTLPVTPGRIFAAQGAIIDVSGATSALLPVSSDAITVNVQGFELRDAPTVRDGGALSSQNVYVDQRLLVAVPGTASGSGVQTYPGTRLYTPGGLLEVSGEVGNISHGIGEFDSPGGTITLSSPQVVAQPGADFDIAGGAITYAAGYVRTSWLVGTDGRLYNVNTAPATLAYTGLYGGIQEVHARWGVTQVFVNPLIAPSQTYDAGYTVGRDAGQLLLSTPTAVFEGTVDAGVVDGQRQSAARNTSVTDPYLQAQSAVPQHGSLAVGGFDALTTLSPTGVVVGATVDTTAATLTPTSALGGLANAIYLSAARLSGFQLGGFSLLVGSVDTSTSFGKVSIEAPLALADGGTVAITGAAIALQAPVTARGGAVSVGNAYTPVGFTGQVGLQAKGVGGVSLASGAAIDSRGVWTNVPAGGELAGAAYVNGGAVTVDAIGSLALAAGSAIDASAGAALLSAGKSVGGAGGNIAVIEDDPAATSVAVAGSLRSIGVTSGGRLLLRVPTVAIGDGLPASAAQVVLPTAFFGSGFSSYEVDATGTIASGDALATSLTVAPGAQVVATEPLYQITAQSSLEPSGTDPGSALQLALLPEYLFDPTRAKVTQRAGASIALESFVPNPGQAPVAGGGVGIGAGALIQVDPGQTIRVEGYGQITVEGTLRAPGGTVEVLNDQPPLTVPAGGAGALATLPTLSVWLGAASTIDVSGVAAVAADRLGRPFGMVRPGGAVTLGSVDAPASNNTVVSTAAAIIVRPGALIDASGTSATIDTQAGSVSIGAPSSAPILVASDAGSIALSSYTGIFPDGTLVARAGGASARGGMLSETLETYNYGGLSTSEVPLILRNPREIVVGTLASPLPLGATIGPGSPDTFVGAAGGFVGQAHLGVDQLAAGGFTRVSLYAHDALLFTGDVTLATADSVTLEVGEIADTSPTAHVTVQAPYLAVGSPVAEVGNGDSFGTSFLLVYPAHAVGAGTVGGFAFPATPTCFGATAGCVSGTLTLAGDQIDVVNDLRFGVHSTIDLTAQPTQGTVLDAANSRTIELFGFAGTTLSSTGDIRFTSSSASSRAATIASSGDLVLRAAQVYPTTPPDSGTLPAEVVAGVSLVNSGAVGASPTFSIGTSSDPRSVITLVGLPGGAPAGPLSAFGAIDFGAATIEQGGIVRAPEGRISFGGTSESASAFIASSFLANVTRVDLLPGSLTSVSANGLTIPFGGTTNGLSYSYNGATVDDLTTALANSATQNGTLALSGFLAAAAGSGVSFTTQSVAIHAGAILDLSGGGTLSGGGGEVLSGGTLLSQGFVSGRGGSTDTLVTPLLSFGAGTVTIPALRTAANSSASTVGVYAIVPSYTSAYAPVTGYDLSSGYYGSLPSVGEQITLPTATAGLPAGTYTLLPSYYALLPGGYRVEFGAAPRTALSYTGALGNGSSLTGGYVGTANTGARGSLAVSVTVTPGGVAHAYSQYDEQGYASFEAASFAQFGYVRPTLPQDAKTLTLLGPATIATPALPSLADQGVVKFDPAPGGYGGTVLVEVDFNNSTIEITPTGTPTPGFTGYSIGANQLDALTALGPADPLGAPRLVIGQSNLGLASEVVVRSGATLSAAEVDLVTDKAPGLFVEPGATITTLGQGPAPVVPSRGNNPNVGYGLVVANSQLGFLASGPDTQLIGIDQCPPGDACAGGPSGLLTDGSVVIAGTVTRGPDLRIGATSLTLAVETLNLEGTQTGTPGTIAVPPGFILTAPEFQGLIEGVPALGLAPLQQLTLIASKATDIYGSLDLDTIDPATGQSSLAQLVLQSPAINGQGAASDTATITTGTFVWTGALSTLTVRNTVSTVPTLGTGTGTGTLDIVADRIVLGYPSGSASASNTPAPRLVTGFAAVDLTAGSEITSTNVGSLTVYEQPGSYVNGQGFVGSGGALTLTTPLITGGAGAVLAVTAGGAITLQAPPGVAPSTVATAAQGAELDLTGASIADTTAIVLPSGRLAMTATRGDIVLGDLSRAVLAGLATPLGDQTAQGAGGTVVLESALGNIVQAASGVIDVSAPGNAGGSLSATATAPGAGAVALLGTLLGGGGEGGSIDVRATVLAQDQFDSLNQRLDAGGFTGSRAFQIESGSLLLGDDPLVPGALLRAHAIDVSVDAGSLTVLGLIDASGAAPGTIRLASSGDLTLAATAVLDAHGTVPQTDLTGAPIDANNTGSVELAVAGGTYGTNTVTATGTLVLQPGAVIDVTGAAPCALGACGRVEFDVPRVGTPASGDLAISAPLGLTIAGAGSVAVNAFWTYTSADGLVTQATLDAAHVDSTAFIAAAEPGGALNPTLAAKLAGLAGSVDTFHLRPGVEIVPSTPDGSLTVGDLDLSRYRYASLDPRTRITGAYGSGEPGVLVLRAGGNLTVTGSINDGFGQATPLQTPDDDGWLITSRTILPGAVVVTPYLVSQDVTLLAGTRFPSNATLNFDLPVGAVTLAPGAIVPNIPGSPAGVTLRGPFTISATFVATGTITVPASKVPGAYPAGTYPAGHVFLLGSGILPTGTVLATGASLPGAALLDPLTWPAGVSLAGLTRYAVTTLAVTQSATDPNGFGLGSVLPAGTNVALSGPLSLRPATDANGGQGTIFGALPMLPTSADADTLSWSLRLVGGADLAAADTRAVQAPTALAALASVTDPAPGSVVLSDLHTSGTVIAVKSRAEVFSVVRTGTGYLDLLAGGDVAEDTLFGVYTAGSQTPGVEGSPYDLARQYSFGPINKNFPDSTVLGPLGARTLGDGLSYEQVVSATYHANYPQGGGDLLVLAQGSVAGDVVTGGGVGQAAVPDSNAIGDWLWRQGGTVDNAGVTSLVDTAWWINFGSYAAFTGASTFGNPPNSIGLIGFTGFGALGGGNVTVSAGGDAGYGLPGTPSGGALTSAALDVAVASTGRVAGATVATSGGGDIRIVVGGVLNAATGASNPDLFGTLTDTRGTLAVSAGRIGTILPSVGSTFVSDPRPQDPGQDESATSIGGPIVVLGDATADLDARGDLVLSGAGDPTREAQVDFQFASQNTVTGIGAAATTTQTWFSLWQPDTAIGLFSAGGNVAPIAESNVNFSPFSSKAYGNAAPTDFRFVYPPILNVTAASQNIYVQGAQLQGNSGIVPASALETAPSPLGAIQMLAGGSIYDEAPAQRGVAIDVSGAGAAVPSPLDPAFVLVPAGTGATVSNLDPDGHANDQSTYTSSPLPTAYQNLALFAFEADTATPTLSATATPVSRFVAEGGDIVDLQVGELLTFNALFGETPATWYIGGKPVRLAAGRDIVESGIVAATPVQAPDLTGRTGTSKPPGNAPATGIGDLIVNTSTADLSAFVAGRDIIYLNADVAGPGQLLVQAGRNLYQADQGNIESLGVVGRLPSSASGGAGITVLAGVGAAGPDYTDFAKLYLDPANLADPAAPLQSQPGRVPETYQAALLSFLQQYEGYTGPAAGALDFFLALPPIEQGAFVLPTFYGELNQAGLQYNDPSSRFYKTYLRGNLAIATLLPGYTGAGYDGAVTLFGGSGIRTDYGGTIQMLVPGGDITLGITAAAAPPASSGVVTQGSGDIDVFAQGSVLLGQSRILTTFGGNVLVWSRGGDINAGRGSKSTVLSTPIGISYDSYGDLTLSPTVPSSGAGIGTLAPIPTVAAGDVNLIAPQGTIDAGEAGIRSSGNANLAALAVVNASNIQVKGSTSGTPVVSVPNIGALAAASAVAGSQSQAATSVAQTNQRKASDSIITVEVISFGP